MHIESFEGLLGEESNQVSLVGLGLVEESKVRLLDVGEDQVRTLDDDCLAYLLAEANPSSLQLRLGLN